MDNSPSANGSNGRSANGKFAKGNPGGTGNPHSKATSQLRAALYAAVKEKHILQALAVILRGMRKGRDADRLAAARELLDRCVGKPVAMDLLERIENLESLLANREGDAARKDTGDEH